MNCLKSQIKINDIKRIILETVLSHLLQTESPTKKSWEKLPSFEKKEHFESEKKDDMDFEESREKLLKNFGSKVTKEQSKEKNLILTRK